MTLDDVLSGRSEYAIDNADVIPRLHEMPEACIDLSVTSPPFPSVYAYSRDEADVGNSECLEAEAPLHLQWWLRGMLRVTRPGRVLVVHCTQIARLRRSGECGLYDFRGLLIRLGQRAGFTYEYDWLVRVNPQSQAIRTRSRALQFAGLEADRAASRGAMGMYLVKFRRPGDNAAAVDSPGEVSRNDWIAWAEACWPDVRETDTLNAADGREGSDTRHICPMQLGIYERCIRLFSNPGEVVFDPFAGIGSCGFVALGGRSPVTGRRVREPRRFYGCELKASYHAAAVRNCARAAARRLEEGRSLFDGVGEGANP